MTSDVIDGEPGPTSSTGVDGTGQSPIGAVERYVTAWQAGDLETLIDCYDPDIVAHYGGISRFAGTHVGRDTFLGVLAESSAIGERTLVSVDQWHDDGDTGAVFATEQPLVELGRPDRICRVRRA